MSIPAHECFTVTPEEGVPCSGKCDGQECHRDANQAYPEPPRSLRSTTSGARPVVAGRILRCRSHGSSEPPTTLCVSRWSACGGVASPSVGGLFGDLRHKGRPCPPASPDRGGAGDQRPGRKKQCARLWAVSSLGPGARAPIASSGRSGGSCLPGNCPTWAPSLRVPAPSEVRKASRPETAPPPTRHPTGHSSAKVRTEPERCGYGRSRHGNQPERDE
jgi:hypothetical protein